MSNGQGFAYAPGFGPQVPMNSNSNNSNGLGGSGPNLATSTWSPRRLSDAGPPSFGAGVSPATSHTLQTPVGVRLPNSRPLSYSHGSETPPPPVLETLNPLFVDTVANELGFGETDHDLRTNLHGFAKMGAGLSKADLATWVYLLGSQFQLAKNLQLWNQNSQHMQAMFQDLYVRFEDNFSLTNDQNTTIRIVVQDHLFNYKCIAFCQAHVEVDAILRAEQEPCQLKHIYQNPNRERVLLNAIKTQCRISRNALRELLVEGVLGDNTVPLDDFCRTVASRFKRGGAGALIAPIDRARLSILRRFTFENQQLSNTEDPPERHPTPLSRSGTPAIDGPPMDTFRHAAKRKRTERPSGRPQKGLDYWSGVDTWFRERTTEWGNQWTSRAWEKYIAETLAWDAKAFVPQVMDPLSVTGPTFFTTVTTMGSGSSQSLGGQRAATQGAAPLTGGWASILANM